MSLMYFARNKNFVNTLITSILLPYLLLCLIIGGLHNNIFNTSHCNHVQLSVHKTTNKVFIGIVEDADQHDPETCQICQWVKTPSTFLYFRPFDIQLASIYISLSYYSNPVLSLLPIHKFTIRPPPFFTSFFL